MRDAKTPKLIHHLKEFKKIGVFTYVNHKINDPDKYK
jgi:hypothetical protein